MNERVTVGWAGSSGIPLPTGQVVGLAALESIDRDHRHQYAVAKATREMAAQGKRFTGDLSAAADLLGPGVIELPRFESQILDLVRRRGVLAQRIRQTLATGQPSRYFEQRTIVNGAFSDPRSITVTPGTPQRSERAVTLKAITGGINAGLFDVEVTRNQGQFSQLLGKDITDMVSGILTTGDKGHWRGSDTDLASPTTLEYVGGQTQINRTFSVSSSASIVDAITFEVASMSSADGFEVKPTAVYAHPMTAQLIAQEERANQRQVLQMSVTDRDGKVIAGLQVTAIATAVGLIPIIPDWSMPAPTASATEDGKMDYSLAIITEDLVEYQYLTDPNPRVFVLGLQSNLATQYVGVMFGAVVFKGKADASNTPETSLVTYAHSFGTVTR